MDGRTTVRYIQDYIKRKDYHPELLKDYFLKLSEEVGELRRAMRKGAKAENAQEIKGSIDEEVWDVIYYALTVANALQIDLERWIPYKEALNREKYGHTVPFDP